MTRQVKERRILLEHCSAVNARAAEERIVTPENIELFRKAYPNREIHLDQWIPFEAPNCSIDGYTKRGGYQALKKALDMKPEEVIAEIKDSALIGRGGAAFPTGLKWESAFKQKEKERYFVCNADEGEPGTFKDKVLLDQDPHKLIEGTIIGAYATSCSKGYIYIRGEYPESAKIIDKAVREAEAKGFLGDNILGSAFSFNIHVLKGAGAYICGEETALFRSIEGQRGIPGIKPPYPTVSGLHKKPTVINNVETLANIPHIILNGAGWFKCLGVQGSFGTKLLSISGSVRNPGVYEVELGKYNLRDLIYGLAGGIEKDKEVKAILPGGGSTRFLTRDDLYVMMDYRSIKEAGSSLGTGAVMVFDVTVSIPEIVQSLFDFYQKESCGNCTPCRVGTKRVKEILYRVVEPIRVERLSELRKAGGPEKMSYLKELQVIGETMKKASKCGLGQAAPDPLLSSTEFFENEYLTFIKHRQREYEYIVQETEQIYSRRTRQG